MRLTKKYIKKVLIPFLIIMLLTSTAIFAAATPEQITERITIGGSETRQFEGIGNKILGIVRVIGIIASVGTLMALGIKYMMGSVEEKAEYKKSFKAYIIGAVLIFSIATIGSKVYEIIKDMLS